MPFAGLTRRLALAAMAAAVFIGGCGDDGTTVRVRSLPDSADVSPGPMEGVWLRIGEETRRTGSNGEAKFGPLSGPLKICELGSSEQPATKTQSCVDVTVQSGHRVELSVSDLGLTLEN